MSDDVRLLYRPTTTDDGTPANGAPHGASKEAIIARNNLGEFLDAVLMRPLWFDESQHMQRVEQALTTMTIAERIAIEIEMTERTQIMHSYDYDALR